MGKPKVLVVSTWGFPGGWRPVNYYVVKAPEVISKWGKYSEWGVVGYCIESFSTTAAQVRELMRDFEVSVVVYGLDTLAAPPYIKVGSDSSGRAVSHSEVLTRCAEELSNRISYFLREAPKGYGEVVRRAEEVLELFVREYFRFVGLSDDVWRVKVLPGVMECRLGGAVRYDFRGSPLNTLVALELDLMRRIEAFKPDAVILDISHGVNYLPLVATESLNRVIMTYSATAGHGVGVAILNSDPVATTTTEAVIHVVKAEYVTCEPANLVSGFGEVFRKGNGGKVFKMLHSSAPSNSLTKLDKYVQNVRRKYSDLVSAVTEASRYGLVLLLVTFASKGRHEELSSDVRKVTELAEEALKDREVRTSKDAVTVEHKHVLLPSELMHIVHVLRVLHHVVEAVKRRVTTDDEVKETYCAVSTEDLEELAKELGLSKAAMTILENELSELRKSVKIYTQILGDLSKWTPYRRIRRLLEESTYEVLQDKSRDELLRTIDEEIRRKECRVNRRNFYAHAGLEMNVVYVKVVNGKTYLSYGKCADFLRTWGSKLRNH